MHPRRPARTSGVEKSNFNPLAVRRYNNARSTGASTSVIKIDQAAGVEALPAVVVDTLPTEAKMLVRGEEGIPASHYHTAYEMAFQHSSRPFSGESVSWSPLIETLIRGESVRQSMQAPCSLSAVDIDSALLCLRHLWDVQLSLSLTSGRPRKKDELVFIQTVREELKAFQLTLKNREISFSIDEKPSLQLALTHLLLGAVSLNLIKLHEKFPENIRAELTPPTDFSNPLHHAHTTASRDQSVLVKLSQAAYDYLEHNGATLSWIRKLQSSDWINEVLQNLGDPSDREDSSSLLELLIRHTETLRKTHQEPIEISLLTVGIYLTVGAGIVLFMKYQVPNPFTAENIKASDNTLGFFAPPQVQASATEAATINPNPNATSTQTLTPSQMQTLSQTLSQTLTQTLSQLLSTSQSASSSPSGTSSQTLTFSQIQTLTQTLSQTLSQLLTSSQSASPTPIPPNCHSALGNFWVETLGGSAYDTGNGLAIAPDGGIVLVGYTYSFGAGGPDVLIAKFESNGTLVWAQTLGGPSEDYGFSLVIAPDASLILVGETYSFGAGGHDVLLAKFQANGSLAWAQTLGGTNNDYGHALAMAPDGSLVLSGFTDFYTAGRYDVILAKFEQNGSLIWAETIGGDTGGFDVGESVVVAPDGSLVLTGETTTYSAGNYDVLIAKFQANGSLVWAQTLGGGAPYDYGYSLVIAPDDSILLTGFTQSFGAGFDDLLLAKFQANGSFSWAQTFGGPSNDRGNSLVITPDGSLILTGFTYSFGAGSGDVLIAKFQANGSLAWAQTIGGPGDDQGESLVIAPNGSLLLTGYMTGFGAASPDVFLAQLTSQGVLAFNSLLIQSISTAQVQRINPIVSNITNHMTVSPWGVTPQAWTSVRVSMINTSSLQNLNCVSASASPTQPASPTPTPSQTLSPSPTPPNCHSALGNFWVETLGGAGDDEGYSLASAPDGSIGLTGVSTSFGAGAQDVLIAKLHANGTLAWAETLGGTGTDVGNSLAIAPDNSLLLIGYTDSLNTGGQDVLLAKFQANGSLTWAQSFGMANLDDYGISLLLTPDDSLLVTGQAYMNTGDFDAFLAKFQVNGSLAWAQTLGGSAYDVGLSLALTPDGGFALTGWTSSFGAGNADVLIAKFQANGSLAWAQTLGGSDNDYGASLAIAPDGSLLLTGHTLSFGAGVQDVLLAKFQANGSLAWAQTLGGTGAENGNSLAIDADGSLALTGSTNSFGAGSYDILIAKFQTNGSLAWAKTLGGTNDDGGVRLTITPNGSLLLTGKINSVSGGVGEALIAQLNSDGSLPFPNTLIRPITTAQVQFINPTIVNITSNMSVASWGVSPRVWSAVNVSSINATLENLNCVSASASPTQTPSQTLSSPPNCNSARGDFWVETLGGAGTDLGTSLAIASDTSLALTGYTNSFGAGAYDVLIAKYYSNGSLAWAKTLGGISDDYGTSLAITPDGSLVLTGSTNSFGTGNHDVLLAKFQANGSLAWAQTLGGINDDEGYSLAIATDGSLALIGYSFGAGNYDVLLAKFQANGSLTWAQTLGGTSNEIGWSLAITPDGGLALTGYTTSFGAGGLDVLLAKFQANGSLAWAQTLGGGNWDQGTSLAIAPDGTLALTGSTNSFGAGNYDVLIAKFQANGSLAWVETFGGTDIDLSYSLTIALDGCLFLTGHTSSFGAGHRDVLIAKFQTNGSLVWAQTLGGGDDDEGYSLAIAPNGSLLLTGKINSVSGGVGEALIAQLNSDGSLPFPNTLIRPITTAQVQFINPTIFNITSLLSVASWGVTPQAWATVNVSSINNATLQNLNCAAGRRLQLRDVKKELAHRRNAKHDAKLFAPRSDYEASNALPSTSPIVRPTPYSRYDALDKSASNASTENSFASLESALGIGAILCLMTLLILYFARRVKPAAISQGNVNFFVRRERALTIESTTTQDIQRQAVHFSDVK